MGSLVGSKRVGSNKTLFPFTPPHLHFLVWSSEIYSSFRRWPCAPKLPPLRHPLNTWTFLFIVHIPTQHGHMHTRR